MQPVFHDISSKTSGNPMLVVAVRFVLFPVLHIFIPFDVGKRNKKTYRLNTEIGSADNFHQDMIWQTGCILMSCASSV